MIPFRDESRSWTNSGEANALRRVRRSEINASGRVRKGAFMPRKQGQDSDGLSVSIETAALSEMHRARFEGAQEHCACCLRVDAIRGLTPLDVVASGDDDDPAHALIVGIPDVTQGDDAIAQAEYFAGELAKRARPYTFPTGD